MPSRGLEDRLLRELVKPSMQVAGVYAFIRSLSRRHRSAWIPDVHSTDVGDSVGIEIISSVGCVVRLYQLGFSTGRCPGRDTSQKEFCA